MSNFKTSKKVFLNYTYNYKSVMESVFLCPKVIAFSDFHCMQIIMANTVGAAWCDQTDPDWKSSKCLSVAYFFVRNVFGYCFIIWLMGSVMVWPKVIPLSGVHCIMNFWKRWWITVFANKWFGTIMFEYKRWFKKKIQIKVGFYFIFINKFFSCFICVRKLGVWLWISQCVC